MAKYTEHYRLHQWEPEDSFLRMDFNEDFAKIDSAIAARGNCLQVVGTYTGDGNYGKGKATVLHFPFRPLAVMVVGGSYQATSLFLRPGTKGAANDTAGMGSVLSLAWGGGQPVLVCDRLGQWRLYFRRHQRGGPAQRKGGALYLLSIGLKENPLPEIRKGVRYAFTTAVRRW